MDEPEATDRATSVADASVAVGGSVRWAAGLSRASGDLVARLVDLELEPESIRQWLNEFGGIVQDLAQRAYTLENLALAAGGLQLGGLAFSEPLKAKLADRIGLTEGGLAWAIDGIVREMGLVHEAMLRSLATHLRADFEAESILNRLNVGPEPEAGG